MQHFVRQEGLYQSDKAPFNITPKTAFLNNHLPYVTLRNDESIFAYLPPPIYATVTQQLQ